MNLFDDTAILTARVMLGKPTFGTQELLTVRCESCLQERQNKVAVLYISWQRNPFSGDTARLRPDNPNY